MYIYTYICNTYIHMYIYTYICTYIHTYINTYIHIYIRTYVHTYIHTYIRTYVHLASSQHASMTYTCFCVYSTRLLIMYRETVRNI